jgi:hypothetical protein
MFFTVEIKQYLLQVGPTRCLKYESTCWRLVCQYEWERTENCIVLHRYLLITMLQLTLKVSQKMFSCFRTNQLLRISRFLSYYLSKCYLNYFRAIRNQRNRLFYKKTLRAIFLIIRLSAKPVSASLCSIHPFVLSVPCPLNYVLSSLLLPWAQHPCSHLSIPAFK